jgi:transposase
MTLNAKVQVPIPKSGVVVRRSGHYPAVYKVTRTYRNQKGQPTNDRVNIGKLDLKTNKLIPNAKYWEYYQPNSGELEVIASYSSNRSFGTEFLFDHIMTYLGINDILFSCLKYPKLVKTAALYMAARGNVFEGVLDYCEDYTIFQEPLSSSSASELFASITFDQRMSFFKKWVEIQPMGKFLAYDVTSFSSHAKEIIDCEWGYNRDGEKLPQINLGCFLGEETGLPVFYVTYPGSIVDKSHLPYMMEYNHELGIKDIGFVLDRGFCSTANIKYMGKEGFPFIMGVPNNCKKTLDLIDLKRPGIISNDNRVGSGVYGISEKGIFYGSTGVMNIYYSPTLAEHKREDLFRTIESQEETLAQLKKVSERDIKPYRTYFSICLNDDSSITFKRASDKIDKAIKNCGFFCLLTNTNLCGTEVLNTYRRRDVIEKGFDNVKNHIDMKRLRTHNSETTDGKLFCSFISLIIVSELEIKLDHIMKKKGWSKKSIIREMEKIRLVVTSNRARLMNPLTKSQRKILEVFGLGEKNVKDYIDRPL